MRFVYVVVVALGCTSSPQRSDRHATYSCFSYSLRDDPTKKFDCYRTEECPQAAQKAKAADLEYHERFGGPPNFQNMSNCVPTSPVWCFHRPDKGDDCSPTAEACRASRVEAQRHDAVDSDCVQR